MLNGDDLDADGDELVTTVMVTLLTMQTAMQFSPMTTATMLMRHQQLLLQMQTATPFSQMTTATILMSTTVATDADCDTVLTADDCDDNNDASTTVATDTDCDGIVNESDLMQMATASVQWRHFYCYRHRL